MRTPVTLVTGASGEIGHGLITRLSGTGRPIVTIDLAPLDPSLHRLVLREFTGSITDSTLLERVLAEFEVDLIFHLAALLSTRAEFTPITAHHVNVDGTLTLLEFAQREGESHGRTVMFLYPSSVAAYGLPDLATKTKVGRIREDEWNTPRTMYGCNKLYCEHLGRYYARFYKQLAAHAMGRVDFRCVRFPGLISAVTMPAGGTSDYAPEMIHAAARREPYTCFVRPDTRIPFMAMPDAISALLDLAKAPRESLTRTAYNLTAFSPTAQEIHDAVVAAFPGAAVQWTTDEKRQSIVDSWPEDVDDGAARRDWGFAPVYDFTSAFDQYLIPNVRERYR
jgi:nucleoside-diphosphate-sugar epimerase